jgi:hypothetical protein
MKKRYTDYLKPKEKAHQFILQELKSKDNYILKMMSIRSEIIKRDVTKRQKNIIDFIFALSLPFSKDEALIPNMQDFEACGVSKTKIRNELDKLISLKMIDWDKEENLFSINDPSEWMAPYHIGLSDQRIKELFFLNLKHKDLNVEEIRPEIEN